MCGVGRVALRCLLLVFALVVSMAAAAGVTAASASAQSTAPAIGQGSEVIGERTRTSRTFRLGEGVRQTEVSTEAVNYRDGQGEWVPVDGTLVSGLGSFHNRAGEYSVELPQRIDLDPVRLERGADWVSFRLQGAAPAVAVATGNEARYGSVFAGVNVAYEARPSRVKETFELASAGARSTFAFDLELAPGLTPVLLSSGTIVLSNAEGQRRMTIAAPFMRDAAGAVSDAVETSLEPDGDVWVLTLTASREWLKATGRQFPVALDPTVVTSTDRFCTIRQLRASSDMGSGYCTTDAYVGDIQDLDFWYRSRVLAHWDLSGIPDDAEITAVTVTPLDWLGASGPGIPTAYPLMHAFTMGVSWDTFDGTSAWTASGGDYDVASPVTTAAALKHLVQDWVSGERANHGVILMDDAADPGYAVDGAPELEVEYELPDGEPLPELHPSELSASSTTPLVDATKFLYEGADSVQTGVEPGTIEPTRVVVLRGRVLDADGDPLSAAKVTIPGHPEFGETQSLEDGQFYMAVNGGGQLTVRYEKDGFLRVERPVQTPWQDYIWADDAVLTPLDSAATEVDLDGTSTTFQVAESSEVSDADGTRTATLLFAPGTTAELVMPDGDREPVTDATVRATEYTVGARGPDAMPGELPPTTAYTYAAEFSLDEALAAGARTVEFSKPVAAYVDNFLGVPTGVNVPTGFYDSGTHAWKPEADGRVVEILSKTGGVAQLDVTGDGVASDEDALEFLGIDAAEQARIAALFDVGDTFSRFTMSHFTPFDGNYPPRLPPGAVGPDGKPIEDETDEDCEGSGSIIGCENQTLGEAIDVAGTDFALRYESDRTPGSTTSRTLRMKLLGSSVHADLEKVVVETQIAGRRFEKTYDVIEPNLVHRFVWDGEDAFGRTVQGAQTARIRVGLVYDTEYATAVPYRVADNETVTGGSSAFNSSWGAMADPRGSRILYSGGGGGGGGGGTTTVSMPPTRGPQTIWQEYHRDLTAFDARAAGLGGWTLDAHHAYDPLSHTLQMGDGTTRGVKSVTSVITDVDDELWTFGTAHAQNGIALGPDGTIYFVDFYTDQVYKRTPAGDIVLVAGDPDLVDTFSGDGGPAIEAGLNGPQEVELLPDGGLLIADYLNHRIRKVDAAGIITTVAGDGTTTFKGDGGPATEAGLQYPTDVELAPDGSYYIADRDHARVRKVDTSGVITTVFGRGSCDGTYCGEQANYRVRALAIAPDGALWIVGDHYYNGFQTLLRKGVDGIARVIGSYNPTEDYEDVPIGEASLRMTSIAFGPDGLPYLSEYADNRIRRLDPDGVIRIVAGGGSCSRPNKPRPGGSFVQDVGNDGPALQACLPNAADIEFAPDGTMYFSDWSTQGIRRVAAGMPGFDNDDISVPSQDGAELYRFDRSGRHLSTVNALTGATIYSFAYDGAGRLAGVTDGDGNETEIERDGSGVPQAIVGPYATRTELEVGGDGWLTEVINAEGEAHTLEYDTGGLLAAFEQPGGFTSTFDYETDGRLRSDTSPDGETKTLTRTLTNSGQEVSVTTGLGRARTHALETRNDDAVHRTIVQPTGATSEQIRGRGRTTVTSADGTVSTSTDGGDPRWGTQVPLTASSTFTTPGGLEAEATTRRSAKLSNPADLLSLVTLEEQISANGRTTTGTYTAATRTHRLETPMERVFSVQTDTLGRPLTTTLPGVTPVVETYDLRGRLESSTQGTRTWSYDYDADGNLAAIDGPESYAREYTYDDIGRVTATTLADGRQVSYTYDTAGRLASITPPLKPTHTLDYTAGSKAQEYTPPASAEHTDVAESYTYDADGRLETVERPGGITVEYGYDTPGRLETVEAGGETLELDYQTTGARQLSQLSAPGGDQAQSFTYDGPLLTQEISTGTVAGSVDYEYDDNLRLHASEVNGGSRAELDYDDDGLLIEAGALEISRRADNGALDGTELDAITSTRTYSAFGELSTQAFANAGSPLFSFSVARDDLGRIESRTETTSTGTHDYDYEYDLRGRLVAVERDDAPWRAYNYDANGNRVTDTTGSDPAVSASYDDQDRLVERDDVGYHYTAAGELSSRVDGSDTTTFEHDAFGQLRGAVLPDDTEIDYVLDGQGRRVGKEVDGTLVQRFLYGEAINPVATLTAGGAVDARFVYGTAGHVPDYMVRGGVTYRFVTDDLGSVRVIVRADTGAVAQELDYDPYGRVLLDTNPGFQPFGWAGGLIDADTGLVRFGARDYDPEAGRWTSKDPIGFSAGDTNLYGYVLGDPVNGIDPLGLASWMSFSEFGAGALNSLTFGIPNALFGVEFCSDAYKFGSLLGDLNPKGLLKRGAQRGFAKTTRGADDAIAIGPGPEKAWKVRDRVVEKGAPLPGYKGGKVFKNEGAGVRLPQSDANGPISYRAWDVNSHTPGVNRGLERLVTGSDGSAFYTTDHYDSFVRIR